MALPILMVVEMVEVTSVATPPTVFLIVAEEKVQVAKLPVLALIAGGVDHYQGGQRRGGSYHYGFANGRGYG